MLRFFFSYHFCFLSQYQEFRLTNVRHNIGSMVPTWSQSEQAIVICRIWKEVWPNLFFCFHRMQFENSPHKIPTDSYSRLALICFIQWICFDCCVAEDLTMCLILSSDVRQNVCTVIECFHFVRQQQSMIKTCKSSRCGVRSQLSHHCDGWVDLLWICLASNV